MAGVDLAIDNIGGTLLPDVIDTLGQNGRVSLVGRLAGPVPQFNTAALFFRRLKLGGVAVGTYANVEAHAAWIEVLRLLSRTGAPARRPRLRLRRPPRRLRPPAAGPMGKVLVRVRGVGKR